MMMKIVRRALPEGEPWVLVALVVLLCIAMMGCAYFDYLTQETKDDLVGVERP